MNAPTQKREDAAPPRVIQPTLTHDIATFVLAALALATSVAMNDLAAQLALGVDVQRRFAELDRDEMLAFLVHFGELYDAAFPEGPPCVDHCLCATCCRCGAVRS